MEIYREGGGGGQAEREREREREREKERERREEKRQERMRTEKYCYMCHTSNHCYSNVQVFLTNLTAIIIFATNDREML